MVNKNNSLFVDVSVKLREALDERHHEKALFKEEEAKLEEASAASDKEKNKLEEALQKSERDHQLRIDEQETKHQKAMVDEMAKR